MGLERIHDKNQRDRPARASRGVTVSLTLNNVLLNDKANAGDFLLFEEAEEIPR